MKEKKGIIITVVVAVIVLGVLSYALAARHKANEPKTAENRETVKTWTDFGFYSVSYFSGC